MSGVATESSSVEEINEKQAPGDVEIVAVEEDLYIDPAREAALLRKLDLHIAPVMSLIFLLAYLGEYTSSLSASKSSFDVHTSFVVRTTFVQADLSTAPLSLSSSPIRS